jgi:hypothetical protein
MVQAQRRDGLQVLADEATLVACVSRYFVKVWALRHRNDDLQAYPCGTVGFRWRWLAKAFQRFMTSHYSIASFHEAGDQSNVVPMRRPDERAA